MFQVLNGPTFSIEERPANWQHEKLLVPDDIDDIKHGGLTESPLAEFPLIEDFEVRVEFGSHMYVLGYLLHFFSPSKGYLADFAWWRHVDAMLSRTDFTIPMGDFANPYYDNGQDWEIIIAENDDLVYVIQGERIYSLSYPVWFKVRKERYLAEWGRAIQACREAFLTNDK